MAAVLQFSRKVNKTDMNTQEKQQPHSEHEWFEILEAEARAAAALSLSQEIQVLPVEEDVELPLAA